MTPSASDRSLRLIVDAYDDPIVRLYCTIRFMILRLRFLDEIGQYLPLSGHVLDVGCGFGLFALHFAVQNPKLHIQGFDLSERRVKMARRAAERLGIVNVKFQVADAASFRFQSPMPATRPLGRRAATV